MKPKDIILIKSNFINSSLQLICHVPNRFGHGSLMARTYICDDEAIVIDVITVYMIYLKKNQLFDLPAAFRGGGPQTHNQHFLSTRIYKTAY